MTGIITSLTMISGTDSRATLSPLSPSVSLSDIILAREQCAKVTAHVVIVVHDEYCGEAFLVVIGQHLQASRLHGGVSVGDGLSRLLAFLFKRIRLEVEHIVNDM